MFLNSRVFQLSHKKIILVLIPFVVIGIVLLIMAQDEPKKIPKTSGRRPLNLPDYAYIYENSSVTCRRVAPQDNELPAYSICDGYLSVINKSTKKRIDFKITFASHLYKNGAELPLDQLNSLQKDKTKVALTFFDKEHKQLNGVNYTQ